MGACAPLGALGEGRPRKCLVNPPLSRFHSQIPTSVIPAEWSLKGSGDPRDFRFADKPDITRSSCTDYVQLDKTTSTESKQMSLERPVAVCTLCGAVSYNAMLIDGVCGRSRGDLKHCRGVYRSALNQTDWAACDKCAGPGWLVAHGVRDAMVWAGWS